MQRSILSPGVEIFEKDVSLIAQPNVGTNVFIAGYAPQGYTDEIIKISSKAELDQIYGTPTNSAERYFYHGVKELLNSNAHIYTARLPYGSGSGVGFGSEYSALVYPAKAYDTALSAVKVDLTTADSTIVLGAPVQVTLSETQYLQIKEGSLFTWSQSGCNRSQLSAFSELGKAGLIILNKAQTTINSQFEGYYVAIADNSNINPSSDYDAIIGAKSVSVSATFTSSFTDIPLGTLQFSLTATGSGTSGSISEIMENLTNYNIDGREDDDLLNIGVFKLRKSLYATESYKLDYILDSGVVGSIDTFRTIPNQSGGSPVSFFLESRDSENNNIEVLVNPYISNKYSTTAVGVDGLPTRKVRVLTTTLSAASLDATGIDSGGYGTLYSTLGLADNLYPVGAYSSGQISSKDLGSIPDKIDRVLELVKNDEIYDIDVVVEAGLGTIYTITQAAGTTYYDDTLYNAAISGAMASLRTSNDLGASGETVRANYSTIFNKFENFCNLPSNTGGRGDCIFIADPIRHIMVTGKDSKILSDRTKNFQTDVYWAMRHQFELENTSYAAVYANWAQVYDDFLGDRIWVPFSPVAAAAYARTDAAEFPWSAPAGYTRGLVSGNVINIAITPNQKQRDELYKSNLNPVLFSPSQGMAIFGQKTMSRKPSAFDRINVRRAFLALERPTKKASKFFVFEPNTEFTRTRFVNTLTPLFEYAKNNGGIYDYVIVCDERNNTGEVIDNNEMRADIYIKPVRTAEYILVTFIATRTDANFQELIGG
jgi:hypothetical protein